MEQQRLQKYLAQCGVASRRAAEEMIRAGRVAINGIVMREMGIIVDPEYDRVEVDGQPVKGVEVFVYYVLNKPVGVLSTVRDDRGRKTVLDLIRPVPARVYPVGRLDYESEGLLLLTNDGDLAARLMHPRHCVSKIYRVVVDRRPTAAEVKRLATGVELDDGTTLPARVEIKAMRPRGTELEFELREGRNRQIRRMCAALNLRVFELRRIQIGPLQLGSLQPGQWRTLTVQELAALRSTTTLCEDR